MAAGGLASRYADALFASAVKKGIVDEIHDSLGALVRLLMMSPALKKYIHSPRVRTEDKYRMVRDLLSERAPAILVSFVELLIEKDRFDLLDRIEDAYEVLYEQYKNILRVKVITPIELDEELERRTLEKLHMDTGRDIRLTKLVDPEIIGGMIIITENRITDGSIRHQLEELRRNLRAVKVS